MTTEPAETGFGALPEFPDLVPIAIEHLDAIRLFTCQFESYSDFNATSLWGWAASVPGSYRIGRLGRCLVVEFGDYLSEDRLLSFLGTDDVDGVAATLIDHSTERGFPAELGLVPEISAQLLDRNLWQIEEQPDQHDYLYDVERLAGCRGRAHKSLRGGINRFESRLS